VKNLAIVLGLLFLSAAAWAAEPFPSSPTTAVAIAPHGKQAVVASHRSVRVCSWPSLDLISELQPGFSHVHDVAISPDERTLLIAGGTPGEAGLVEIWSWPDHRKLKSLRVHNDVVYRVAWSADGTAWATASADGTCAVFPVGAESSRATFRGHSRPVTSVAFLPDSASVVSAGVDQSLKLWEAASAREIRSLDNHAKGITDLALRPSPEISELPPMVATAGEDRTVRFWQPARGRLVRFARLTATPWSIAWTRDGRYLIAGCQSGRLEVIDPETAEVVKSVDGDVGRIQSLAADPQDTQQVLVGGQRGAVVVRW
jgi:WD40 repeat protein